MKKLIFSFLLFFVTDSFAKTVLIFGGQTGWLGQQLMIIFKNEGYQVYAAKSRLEDRHEVAKELDTIKPDCVINAAGVTGIFNVDWCESNKQQTIRANILGALNLADLCFLKNIHMINIGTGCIYEYDEEHAMNSGIGFKEEEVPNFHGSFYSHTKIMLDDLLQSYPNLLNLRLRMPISSDFHPKSFMTKITKYQKVVNIPNSMSILDDLLPLLPKMVERTLTGRLNFVNPGVISHNEILDLYIKYVDPTFRYQNFTVEEQDKILKARRSNNHLDTSRLEKEFPELRSIKESIVTVMKRMAQLKR